MASNNPLEESSLIMKQAPDILSVFSVDVDINNSTFSLNTLELNNCTLTGTIPSNLLATMPLLERLDLGNNRLYGSIPSTGASDSDLPLRYLDLGSNLLVGSIPDTLPLGLEWLDLSENVGLTGSLPMDLAPWNKLQHLELHSNPNLKGQVSFEVCRGRQDNFTLFEQAVVGCNIPCPTCCLPSGTACS
uniref:Uncharacterized protein n=1 Tax=Grammatophora oceanica TaxID=210454 RepID=A0A7S1VLP8_9STRA